MRDVFLRKNQLINQANSSFPLQGTKSALAPLHDRRRVRARDRRLFRPGDLVCLGMYEVMSNWDLVLGSAIAVALTVYLVYAMLRPEKF
jgi:K+-transporting ATPase KdpF subunit